MGEIDRCYRAQMRFVAGSEETFWVRWFPAAPDATPLPWPTVFLPSGEFDAMDDDPPVGEVRAVCREYVSCNYTPPPESCLRGDADTFAHGITQEQLDNAEEQEWCGGGPMARWAELIDRSLADSRYGWWELRCNTTNGHLERGPNSWRHRIEEDPAWEVQGKIGLPVPGTIVRIVDGCDGRPWHFRHDDLTATVRLAETTPSVDLGFGVSAYLAYIRVPLLIGEAGLQTLTGVFADATAIYALDLAAVGTASMTVHLQGRLLGNYGGRQVYSVSVPAGGGGGGGGPPVVTATGGDITDYNVADYPDQTRVFIENSVTGAVGQWIALTFRGTRGWVDLCTCSESWWCLPSGCEPWVGDPGAAISGPYPTLDCCDPACIPGPCGFEGTFPNLHYAISLTTGWYVCMEADTGTLEYGTWETGKWSRDPGIFTDACCDDQLLILECTGTSIYDWKLTVNDMFAYPTHATYSPFMLIFDLTGGAIPGGCPPGTPGMRVTITRA